MRPILICILFAAAATAADDPAIQRADSIYSSTVKKVNESAAKARRDAAMHASGMETQSGWSAFQGGSAKQSPGCGGSPNAQSRRDG